MKNAYNLIFYIIIAITVFSLDRITKVTAVANWATEQVITPFLSLQLTFNSGISWGLFSSSNVFMLTFIILIATLILVYYSYKRLKFGHTLYGEILVLTGSASNLIDRLIYGGVVDFILFHIKDYSFPYFNIADSAIVLGVFIMFIQLVHEQ